MNHPFGVGVRQRLGRLSRDAERLVHGQAVLAPQALAQTLAAHVGHGEPELPAGLAGIVDAEDVGVLQAGGGGDLASEALGAERVRELGEQHLERHRALVLHVAGEPDRRHAPAPDLALQRVLVAQASLEVFVSIRHGLRGL